MSALNLARLLALGALWGGSFLFMRVASAEFSAVAMIMIRLGLGAAVLWLVALAWRKRVQFAGRQRHYLVVCTLNSTVPFLLWAYAASTLPVSVLSILNATAPMWAALIGATWLGIRMSKRATAGLLLGIAGVALLTGIEALRLETSGWLAVFAALVAALCYAFASHHARRSPSFDPFETTVASLTMGALSLAPVALFAPWPEQIPSMAALGSVGALACLSTAAAYLIYFRLVSEVGAAPALTVTYLTPLFGCAWGALFLGEPIGWHTAAGGAAVLGAVGLITGVRFPTRRAQP